MYNENSHINESFWKTADQMNDLLHENTKLKKDLAETRMALYQMQLKLCQDEPKGICKGCEYYNPATVCEGSGKNADGKLSVEGMKVVCANESMCRYLRARK
jgi:hypothetical protein